MSTDKKADFSDVKTNVDTTAEKVAKADFSDVNVSVDTTAEKVAPASQSYTVEKGDTLSHIAKEVYGKPGKWRVIFEANRGLLDDPDKIFPGQVLTIPALDDGDAD